VDPILSPFRRKGEEKGKWGKRKGSRGGGDSFEIREPFVSIGHRHGNPRRRVRKKEKGNPNLLTFPILISHRKHTWVDFLIRVKILETF
jgi:hypothetical protein